MARSGKSEKQGDVFTGKGIHPAQHYSELIMKLTTIANANNQVKVNQKAKTAGVWSTKVVPQPQAIATHNKYMNAVDRSDQILATNNLFHK